MGGNSNKSLVILNGTLIDGSGNPPTSNEAVVIKGNRIKSTGPLPADVNLEDRNRVQVIDASGKWILPGLIDGHCHLSFGMPQMPTIRSARDAINPEFSTLRAARNAQKVMRSGVTSICVPGGTWFIDVGVRDAITAGLIEGPRICCAGRFIITYDSIIDSEPSWVGAPEHSVGILANTMTEMVTEVRRQCKHGVDFIKVADSVWGDTQTISKEELKAVADEAHRRNTRITIHSRGSGSTRAAVEAGFDWIIHGDLATESDLDALAEAGIPLMPTITFLKNALEVGHERGRSEEDLDMIRRNLESSVTVLQRSRELGLKVLCGTDSGNSPIMPYGQLHAVEAEIMVSYGGYTSMEAIIASTRDNAYAVGLEGQVGTIQPGWLADLIILNSDPIADVRVLQRGRYLDAVIKDGKPIDLHGEEDGEPELDFRRIRD